jgi:hypothetical protein
MPKPRRLSLKSETLTELSAADLGVVVGGANAITAHPCVIENSVRVCSLNCPFTAVNCGSPE